MSDDKMRAALELMARGAVMENRGSREPMCVVEAYQKLAREALASAQPEGPELTDAELDEIWTKHAMSATFDCVHLLRDAIAADRARRGGAEAEPAVIRIGGEDFPRHIALEALGVAMNTTLTSGLQGFADRIKNDLHWSQYFEADHALLMEAIAELKRNRQTQPAAPVVPDEWREVTKELVSHLRLFTPFYDDCQCQSCVCVRKAGAMLAAIQQDADKAQGVAS